MLCSAAPGPVEQRHYDAAVGRAVVLGTHASVRMRCAASPPRVKRRSTAAGISLISWRILEASLDIFEPYMHACGLSEAQRKIIRFVILCTEVAPIGDAHSPVNIMKARSQFLKEIDPFPSPLLGEPIMKRKLLFLQK